MPRPTLIFCLIFCLISKPNQAQPGLVKIDTLLIGTWNGSSICQQKNSPCHDETVVYHISKKMGVDTFYVDGYKVVNGVEDEMGILPFVYNKATNQLTSTAYGIWTFKIEGDKMEGTLTDNGALYRKILLHKHH